MYYLNSLQIHNFHHQKPQLLQNFPNLDPTDIRIHIRTAYRSAKQHRGERLIDTGGRESVHGPPVGGRWLYEYERTETAKVLVIVQTVGRNAYATGGGGSLPNTLAHRRTAGGSG